MSPPARDLVRYLAAADVDAAAPAVFVSDMAAARAAAINREGLQAQIAYLLESNGPAEIEGLGFGHRPRENRP